MYSPQGTFWLLYMPQREEIKNFEFSNLLFQINVSLVKTWSRIVCVCFISYLFSQILDNPFLWMLWIRILAYFTWSPIGLILETNRPPSLVGGLRQWFWRHFHSLLSVWCVFTFQQLKIKRWRILYGLVNIVKPSSLKMNDASVITVMYVNWHTTKNNATLSLCETSRSFDFFFFLFNSVSMVEIFISLFFVFILFCFSSRWTINLRILMKIYRFEFDWALPWYYIIILHQSTG